MMLAKVTYQSTDGGMGQLTVSATNDKEIKHQFYPHRVVRIEWLGPTPYSYVTTDDSDEFFKHFDQCNICRIALRKVAEQNHETLEYMLQRIGVKRN